MENTYYQEMISLQNQLSIANKKIKELEDKIEKMKVDERWKNFKDMNG